MRLVGVFCGVRRDHLTGAVVAFRFLRYADGAAPGGGAFRLEVGDREPVVLPYGPETPLSAFVETLAGLFAPEGGAEPPSSEPPAEGDRVVRLVAATAGAGARLAERVGQLAAVTVVTLLVLALTACVN